MELGIPKEILQVDERRRERKPRENRRLRIQDRCGHVGESSGGNLIISIFVFFLFLGSVFND